MAPVRVAVIVVDALKTIQIDEATRQAQVMAHRAAYLAPELIAQRCVVQGAGQAVELGALKHCFEHARLLQAQRREPPVGLNQTQRLGRVGWRRRERGAQHPRQPTWWAYRDTSGIAQLRL